MQTFLPYEEFEQSLDCLDYRRLGKQRVEAMQILNALHNKTNGWRNHPAVKMWRGYEDALTDYMNLAIILWKGRGYRNTMKYGKYSQSETVYPSWLGNFEFHKSHRSNLLRKDSEFYGQYGWTEPDNLPYVWPIHVS